MNVGSNENENSVINPRFPGEGSSALGKSGPKVRLKSVADG